MEIDVASSTEMNTLGVNASEMDMYAYLLKGENEYQPS